MYLKSVKFEVKFRGKISSMLYLFDLAFILLLRDPEENKVPETTDDTHV